MTNQQNHHEQTERMESVQSQKERAEETQNEVVFHLHLVFLGAYEPVHAVLVFSAVFLRTFGVVEKWLEEGVTCVG